MRTMISALSVCLLAAGALPATASMDAVQRTPARVFAVPGGGMLTIDSQAEPVAVLGDFLRSLDHGAAAVSSVSVLSQRYDGATGRTYLRAEQRVDGLRVFGTEIKAVYRGGALANLIENLVPVSAVQPARIGSAAAIDAAVSHLYSGGLSNLFGVATLGDGFFYRAPQVERVAIPVASGLAEGFLVETWTIKGNQLHYTLVNGAGRVLGSQLRTNTDSYNIFPDHPGNSSQTVTAGAGAGNAQSPVGWLDAGSQGSQDISGNNVNAYLDTDNDNASDGIGTTINDGNFLTAANLSQSPSTSQNQDVAVQNLFYLNNVIHDELYKHGFVEGAGNFQNDNFGNGGVGNDSVDAEAQDGGSTNNANFSTPNDGTSGRMQMYLWTQSSPSRDGDVDSDIVYHEYCHGLTWRMIGNMSGPMAGAIGEGMSDTCSLLMNENDVVGEYSFNDPLGIRSETYTNYSRTYGDFGGSSVHFDGEIYAATMWDLLQRFNADGISKDALWDYVVGGMNFTPAGPTMDEMRDGILAAASGSGDECRVWEVFAAHGIGEGASAKVKGGGPFGGGKVTVTESFTVPAFCAGGCVPTESPESSCSDGLDNDCDGLIDSADPDCGGGCFPVGASCVLNSDCCSNKCKGPSGGKTCK